MRARLLVLPLLLLASVLVSCGDDGPTAPGVRPGARFTWPLDGAYSSVSDSVRLNALVWANGEPLPNAAVAWRSDLDGPLAAGRTDEQGWLSATVPPLSRGTHRLVQAAEVGYRTTVEDTVTLHNILPARVAITGAERSLDGVALAWTVSDEPAFARYELRRWVDDETYEDGVVLRQIAAAATTSALDSLPPIAGTAHYAVTVVIDGELVTASGTASVDEPCGPVFAWYPYDAVIHPTEPRIYVSEGYNFFGTSRLVAVDYLAWETFAHREYDHELNFLDIADNGLGVELYVTHADSGFSVLDPLTLAETERVDLGYWGCDSVASDGLGHVWVSFPSADEHVRCYDRATWDVISQGGHHGLRLRHVPGSLQLLGIQVSVHPPSMEHVAFDAAGQITAMSYCPRPYGVSPYCMRVDPTGSYLLTNEWAYEPGPDATVIGALPAPDDRYHDFAFSSDGSVIYAAERHVAAAAVIANPSLTRTGEIPLCGYPLKLFRQGEYLIALVRTLPNDGGTTFAVDVVRLPQDG